MILILAHDAYDLMVRKDEKQEDGSTLYVRGLVTEYPLLTGDIIILPYWHNARSVHEESGWMPGTELRIIQVKNKWVANRYPRGDNFAAIKARALNQEETEALTWLECYHPAPMNYTEIESHAPVQQCTCTICGNDFRALVPGEKDCSTLCREKRIAINTGITPDLELLKAL